MAPGRAWTYRNPVQILFGCGRVRELGSIITGRALLVTTAGLTRRGLTAQIVEQLGAQRVRVFDSVQSNPDTAAVALARRELSNERVDTIVAVGGGSAIDFAKALIGADPEESYVASGAYVASGLSRTGGPVADSTSIVPPGGPVASGFSRGRAPFIAIPTTAGSGSEVTPFATLWDRVARKKTSIAAPNLYPTVALLDPELTVSLPWAETLASGLDAYAQCFEAVWNRNKTPVTTQLAKRGLELAPGALRLLQRDPEAIGARIDMLETSLLSGLAIAQTRTALTHSMSYPITAHLGVPHGLACSFTVPAMIEFNFRDEGLARTVLRLYRDLGVAEAFRKHVPDYQALYDLVPEMLTPGRADNNLREASLDDVRNILRTTEEWLFKD